MRKIAGIGIGMSKIDQETNHDEFFNKYGFTRTLTMKHPTFKDTMKFTGLEADYVGILERRVADLEKFVAHQNEKMDWLRDREFYKTFKKDDK